jgi:hypothetical protein
MIFQIPISKAPWMEIVDDYLIGLAKRFRVSLTAFQFRLENI